MQRPSAVSHAIAPDARRPNPKILHSVEPKTSLVLSLATPLVLNHLLAHIKVHIAEKKRCSPQAAQVIFGSILYDG